MAPPPPPPCQEVGTLYAGWTTSGVMSSASLHFSAPLLCLKQPSLLVVPVLFFCLNDFSPPFLLPPPQLSSSIWLNNCSFFSLYGFTARVVGSILNYAVLITPYLYQHIPDFPSFPATVLKEDGLKTRLFWIGNFR